jgi:hypothetical protein
MGSPKLDEVSEISVTTKKRFVPPKMYGFLQEYTGQNPSEFYLHMNGGEAAEPYKDVQGKYSSSRRPGIFPATSSPGMLLAYMMKSGWKKDQHSDTQAEDEHCAITRNEYPTLGLAEIFEKSTWETNNK